MSKPKSIPEIYRHYDSVFYNPLGSSDIKRKRNRGRRREQVKMLKEESDIGLEEWDDIKRFGMPDWLYIDLCCEAANDAEPWDCDWSCDFGYLQTGEAYL